MRELHLCLGITTLVYSLYTGLYLFASLPRGGSPSLGPLGTPQVGYLVIIPLTSMRVVGREAGLLGELIAGTWIRKKPMGSGEVAAVTSFRSTVLLSRDQPCPSPSSPASGAFSQLLSGTRKDRACRNQGSALSMIMTAVETVNITEPKGKGRTSLGQCGERSPTLHFFLPSQAVTGTPSFPP